MSQNLDYCFNCDSGKINILKKQIFKNVCTNCGAWVVALEDDIDFKVLYGEKYYLGDEYLNYDLGKGVHRRNFDRKIALLKKYLAKKDEIRILEIGSATGEFLSAARTVGWNNSVGVEISDFARQESLNSGHNVISPTNPELEKILTNLKPNVIVAWDVWEHLNRPSEIINEYLKYATDDAIVALTTVDAGSSNAKKRQEKWRQFHPPTHINYPTKFSLQQFFESKNYITKCHFYFGYYRPLAEYLAVFLGKKKIITDSKFLFSIPLYLNLNDTQIIVVEKK